MISEICDALFQVTNFDCILLAKADKLDVVYYIPFALLIGYYHVAGRWDKQVVFE